MKNVRDVWKGVFEEFDRTKNHPAALVPAGLQAKRVMIFGQPNTNLTRCLRDALPLLGTPVYVRDHDFFDDDCEFLEEEFESSLRHYDVDLVLFNSPYGNDARDSAYRWGRKTRFPYLSFERAAFPESWFFDRNGFNADSSSYDREIWDRPLNDDETEKAEAAILRLTDGMDALEKQGDRIGGEALAGKLRIGGRKVLFVPLQRPSDTVTVHMAGVAENCAKFLSGIDEAARLLKCRGWVVLCKKYPLETAMPPPGNPEYVDADTNFLDLLELGD